MADTDARMDLYQRAGGTTTPCPPAPTVGTGPSMLRSPRTATTGARSSSAPRAARRIRHGHRTGRVRALQRYDDPRVDRSRWWQRRLPGDLRRNLPGRIEGVLRHRGVTGGGRHGRLLAGRLSAVQWDDDPPLDGVARRGRPFESPSPARARTAPASTSTPPDRSRPATSTRCRTFTCARGRRRISRSAPRVETATLTSTTTRSSTGRRRTAPSHGCGRGAGTLMATRRRRLRARRRGNLAAVHGAGRRQRRDGRVLGGLQCDRIARVPRPGRWPHRRHIRALGRQHNTCVDGAQRRQRRKFAAFQASNTDGSRVFFHTTESLLAEDTDSDAGRLRACRRVTTLISQGPESANAPFPATYKVIARWDQGLLRHQRASERGDRDLSRHI